MKSKKKLIITLFSLLIFLSLFAVLLFNNKSNLKDNYEKINIDEINNNHYEISINVNDSTATIDGKKYVVEEIDDVSNNEIYDYIKDNSYGEVTLNGEKIEITNPYSLETLIVKTDDQSVFDEYENIDSVEEIKEDLYKVIYKSAKETKEGFEELNNDEKIKEVYTDIKVHALGDVSSYSTSIYSWGTSSTGLDFYSSRLEETNNSTIIKIAVLDTGIRKSHEAFTSETEKDRLDLTYAYDYVNNDDDPEDDNTHGTYEDSEGNPQEIKEYGHGTMVSGVIAQSTPKNVKIVPVKVLNDIGDGLFSDILRAINDLKGKVDIVNLSLGTDGTDTQFNNFLKEIYDDTDLIIVAAVGNEKGAVSFPANSAYTLAISSINSNNEFSSSYSNHGDEVDFAAPGEDMALPSLYEDNSYVNHKSGTSFSTPYAASAIALIKAENPTLNRDEIINILKQYVVDLGEKGKDEYYGYGSISIHSFINSLSVSDSWANTNKLTVSADAVSETNYYAITKEEVEPTNWTKLADSKNITIDKDINENGNYYLWIKNNAKTKKYTNNGDYTLLDNVGITHTQFVVSKVDGVKPKIVSDLNITNISASSIDVNLTINDSESGLSKVIWYYKRAFDTNYNQLTDLLNNELDNKNISKSFTELDPYTNYTIYAEIYDQANNKTVTKSVTTTTLQNENVPYVIYQTHVQNIGWQNYVINGQMSGTQGQALRLEGIKIKLENLKYDGNIEYRTHIQNIGWESSFKKNDEMSGTSGLSYRLEAIEIKLTGEIANRFDIYYRVHAENFGWLGWARNGERSGTAGYAYRLEGIEIKLIPKGEKITEYGKAVIFYDKNSGSITPVSDDSLISYTTHVQDIGWQNYVQDGRMAGTQGQAKRLEGIKIKLVNQKHTGDIEYRTHIQNIGWEPTFKKNDEMSGTQGLSYRLEAIEIKLTGDMENHYDVYYRVHAENFGWLGWARNGEQAGTAGYAYRLEGIEIKLIPKGETFNEYGTGPKMFYQK